MLRALRARFPLSRGIAKDFQWWRRAFYWTLPFLILANFFILFHWTFFETVSRTLWPDETFHPIAPPVEAHDEEGPGYFTWDTATQFAQTKLNLSKPCSLFPTHLLRHIQVVLKVGAADHWSRTESQLSTVIKCISNVLIVSDMEHSYGRSHRAHDVLASLPASTYLKASDYTVYSEQKNASQSELKQGHDGWRIDKYKFLPEVVRAVATNPDAKWFVFLESDTYIFWDNLFRLLENYNPRLPYYFGSPSPGRKIPDTDSKIWFAYGGAGFVLSNAAAHRLVDRKRNALGIKGPSVEDEYKEDIQNDCCGDSILGWALHDKAGVDISGLWPMFNPHPLHGIPFSSRYWCEPVISLHKTRPEDFAALWKWENRRDRTTPLLYAHLLTYLHLDTTPTRPNWDNADWNGFHEPDDHPAHTSYAACQLACSQNSKCSQFTWHAHRCWMAPDIRLGGPKEPDGDHDDQDRKYVSGWDVDKIRRWKEENTCAEGAHWVRPSVERIF